MDLNLYLKQLETLVNIDSGSHNAAGVNKVADVIAGTGTWAGTSSTTTSAPKRAD